jgi:hypothetical protein
VRQHTASPACSIKRPEDHAPDAVKQHRPHAHHARLKRRVARHSAAGGPQFGGHPAEGLHFGMPARMVVGLQYRIAGFGNHFVVEHDDGANRQIAEPLGFKRETNRAAQMVEIPSGDLVRRSRHDEQSDLRESRPDDEWAGQLLT